MRIIISKRRMMYKNLLDYACFMYPKCFLEIFVHMAEMKRSFACSDLVADIGFELTANTGRTAMGAACTLNLVLPTSVSYKLKVGDTAKGIKTPSQNIIIEVQVLCREQDVHK
jgi:hypothetical protein